jgi:phosphopantetheinyl transferase
MGKESAMERTALFWSAKESVFKWYGKGQVDFRRDIRLDWNETGLICDFRPAEIRLPVRYILFDDLVLTWVMTAGSAT